MAEGGGIIERYFGGESGEEAEGENIGAACDPIAASVLIDAAKYDPELSREATAYLRRQAHLVAIQTEHLHEQREVQLSHLKLRRFTDRLKAGTQLFIVLVATVIGIGGLLSLYDAFTSRSVVVDAFKTPAALAGRGVTGEVVAAAVLDELEKLQDATRAPTQGLNTKGAWASDIKIEVPETGVSIGEVSRLLHERFGHDQHIDGDLVQTETGGLALTVRGDEVPAATFSGTAGDVDRLATQAAEYVYGRSQPIQYTTYLEQSGRDQDALAFLPGAYARAHDDAERARLANNWGNAYGNLFQPEPAVPKYQLTIALSPDRSKYWWIASTNLIVVEWQARGEEAAWRLSRAFLSAAAASSPQQRPELRAEEYPGQVTWDLPLELAAYLDDVAKHGGVGSNTSIEGPTIADVYALMHDPANAERHMASSDPSNLTTQAEALLLQGYTALDRGDAKGAITPLEGFYKIWLANPTMQGNVPDQPCYLGLAYGRAGHTADAKSVFAKITKPWSRCYAFQGEALANAGDVAGAQRVWAEGVRTLPDLPNVYMARGLWEMNRGDLKAAEVDLSTAASKAPHFADPWKAWGDLIAKEGRWKDAVSKYDVALRSAPAWADLHRARDTAARKV